MDKELVLYLSLWYEAFKRKDTSKSQQERLQIEESLQIAVIEMPEDNVLDLKKLKPKKRVEKDKIGNGAMGQVHKGRKVSTCTTIDF